MLILAPWPVAYAQSYKGGITGQDAVQIEVAEPAVAPSWTAFGKAIGGIAPGDLFYIDAEDNAADILVTLHLTNTKEIIRCYRYLILKVGMYARSSTNYWKRASRGNDELIPDTYITLRNGQVSFALPGYAKYKVTLDGGCFYCITTNTDGGSVSPQFYLTVD